MRKLILAVITAAPMLATLPVAAQADPFGPGRMERGDHFGGRHGEHVRPGEQGRHFGRHGHPWWFRGHRFEHDYGWYRGRDRRGW